MKKLVLIVIVIHTQSITSHAQWPCSVALNFGNIADSIYLRIDTIYNASNIWQIGAPQKVVFINSLGPAAIVTDTLNPYPVNDTSAFILKHVACDGFSGVGMAKLSANYYVDSDSLNDYGKIEFSPDNGLTWVCISDDSTIYNSSPWPTYINQPILTGASNQWKSFGIMLYSLDDIFNVNVGDTVLFRFTFISDGSFDLRDGLMFDNIEITDDYFWGIHDLNGGKLFVYPNPTLGAIKISFDITSFDPNARFEICDLSGRQITLYSMDEITNLDYTIDLSEFKGGTYILKVINTDKSVFTNKIIVFN